MRSARRGFTLIELLVVIAIIGVLVAILLPAVQQAREAARASQCRNNLKNIGLAIHNYHEVFAFFPYTSSSATAKVAGWAVAILPQLDQQALANRYDYNQAWDHANNSGFKTLMPAVYKCPSAQKSGMPAATGFQTTDYTVVRSATNFNLDASLKGLFSRNEWTTMKDCVDGLSNTFMTSESAGRATWYVHGIENPGGPFQYSATSPWGGANEAWTGVCNGGMFSPKIFTFPSGGGAPAITWYTGSDAINTSNFYGAPYAWHADGVHIGLGDGSVRYMSETIAVEIVAALSSRNGKELVGEF